MHVTVGISGHGACTLAK
jgi:hypothetical protein